jgi:hypothetical protein
MTFKTRKSLYTISIAPTGRAHCRKCKRLVGKGELRILIKAFVRPSRATTLVRCCACIDTAFARTVLSSHDTAARVPVEASVAAADAAAVRAELEAKGDEPGLI